VMLAGIRFGAHGIATTVMPGTSGVDTVLVDDTGQQFPLQNLISALVSVSPQTDEFHERLIGHVDAVVEGMAGPPITELSDEDWEQRVRIRLLPESARVDLPANYAQQVVPGLIAVLCIDSPRSVAFVADPHLEGRNVRALFDAGFRSVMAEPVDENEEIAPGIRVIAGSSMFIATKMIGIRSLIGSVIPDAPFGVIIGVPHRHLIVVHVLTGAASAPVIGQLAGIVAAQANDEAPGGPLSNAVYYWRDDVFEPIGGPDETGKIHIWPTDRLMTVLNAG
jgi:hypothetical protein